MLAQITIKNYPKARTFGDRFADFPVRIAVMSRFQTKKEKFQWYGTLKKARLYAEEEQKKKRLQKAASRKTKA